LFLLTVLLPQDNTILRDSQTAPYVHRFTRTFCALIPEDLRSSFQEKSLALHRSWQKKDLNDLSKE
jgi:hypothetical protein